ncbi:MAG: hypothetical protein OXH48_00565 [Chloroflexi bacterium]|nr:hypothetical protein [Chloroflexota bacterium]MXV92153.1 hypothetical protein [Chloroflexota bacterium]MYC54470.1 hypothetical protein [Chloroflexota bacterium]
MPILLALCLAPLLLFAALGWFTRPYTDDFCHITDFAQRDMWQLILRQRNADNNGSYLTLVTAVVLGPFGLAVAQIFPALLLALHFVSTTALLNSSLALLGVGRRRWVISVGVSALLVGAVCASVLTRQVYYWYIASMKYSLPLVLLQLYLLLVLHCVSTASPPRRRLFALVGGVWCFFIAGYAETFSIVMLLGLGVIIGLAWRAGELWRERCLPILSAGWLATAASAAVMVTAPAIVTRFNSTADRPSVAQRSLQEYLAQVADTWFSHLTVPAALAAFTLMLAVGILLGLWLPAMKIRYDASVARREQLALLPALLCQLLLIPLLWSHTSDNAIFLGRFSLGYSIVVAINALLIVGFGGLLFAWRRYGERSWLPAWFLPCTLLVAMLLCSALTHGRAMHWRAYDYLWLSFHSLGLVLCWAMAARMGNRQARVVLAALGGSLLVALLGTALVAFATILPKPQDAWRVYTFLAHLNAWLGLAYGLCIGQATRSLFGQKVWFKLAALLAALWLGGAIIVENLQLLPQYQAYARQYDEWDEMIVAGQQAGQRDFTFTLPEYDLPHELRVWRSLQHRCRLAYYDIDTPTVLNKHSDRE